MLPRPQHRLIEDRRSPWSRAVAAGLVSCLVAGLLVVGGAPIAPASSAEAQPVGAQGVRPELDHVGLAGVDRASLPAAAAVTPSEQSDQLLEEGVDLGGLDDQPEVLTERVAHARFDAIGVSWAPRSESEPIPAVWVRVREAAGWSDWYLLPPVDVRPDADTPEAAGISDRGATEPLVTGGADAFQVRVDAGGRLEDLRADVIDGGRVASRAAAGGTVPGLARVAGGRAAPARLVTPTRALTGASAIAPAAPTAPPIITRAQWGADESLRTGGVSYSSSIKVGVIHHTATSNGYSWWNADAQIRSIYAYHTMSLGWSDIAYNFLVDKDGRVYEGRYGGVDRAVIGAATGGFNRYTFSVSALGNFDDAGAPPSMVESIAQLMAWKYSIHYVNPFATSQLTSAGAGTSRYAAGQVATVPNLIAHRDTNYTSCPGANLYGQLDAIRFRIKQLLPAGLDHPTTATTYRTPIANGSVRVTSGMLYGGNWSVRILRADGSLVRQYVGTGWAVDLTWPMVDGAGAPVPDGVYQIRVDTEQNGSGAVPFSASVSTAGVFGNFEALMVSPSGTVASGWAAVTNGDPASVALVTDTGSIVRVPADQTRLDVGAVYPTLGPNRGFSSGLSLPPGLHLVCAWGEAAGLENSLLGCRWVDNLPDHPIGNVESSSALAGGLRVTGWALDRHTANAVNTRLYVDGRYAGDRPAAGPRSDVAAVYPAYGAGHGFSYDVNTAPGVHQVCINGLNVGPGTPEVLLNCVTAATASGPPIGNFEQLQAGSGSVRVSGWTFDPDTTAATSVHVYVDGWFSGAFPASVSRPDLAGPYPFMGTAHGFDATVGAPATGRHTVCVYAINAGPPAPNPLLGCSAFG